MTRSSAYLVAAALCLPGASVLGQGTGTVLLPNPQNPTTRVGTRGANFLEIGVGARGLALAGAYTALAEGVTALYWNPAGIVPCPADTMSKLRIAPLTMNCTEGEVTGAVGIVAASVKVEFAGLAKSTWYAQILYFKGGASGNSTK